MLPNDQVASGRCRPAIVGRVVGCQRPAEGSAIARVYVDVGEIDLIGFQTSRAQPLPEGVLVEVIETTVRSAADAEWVGYRSGVACVFGMDPDGHSKKRVTQLSPWFRVGSFLSEELKRIGRLESMTDDLHDGLLVVSPLTARLASTEVRR